MPKGELFINELDAYIEWGISLDTTSLSALMTPAPNKEIIENKSRLENGKRIIPSNIKKDERTLNLTFNLCAPNEEQFFSRYDSFCKVLDMGVLNIRTKYQPSVLYRTYYISCQQFTQFMRGVAKYSLRLCEPDPTNRDLI